MPIRTIMASMLCHYKTNLDNEHAKHKTTLKDLEAELARRLEKYTLRWTSSITFVNTRSVRRP